MSRREQVERTEGWQIIESLSRLPEQREYALLRPILVFGDLPAGRARETGAQERALYGKAYRCDEEGMPSLFDTPYQRSRSRKRLFDLSFLDDAEWMKALRMRDHALCRRSPWDPVGPQDALLSA